MVSDGAFLLVCDRREVNRSIAALPDAFFATERCYLPSMPPTYNILGTVDP